MFIRLWFWSRDNNRPRIVAHGSGQSLRGAMAGCFAPMWDRSWQQTEVDGDIYLSRRGAGYCGQIVGAEDEPIRPPRPSFWKPPTVRQRLRLDDDDTDGLEIRPKKTRVRLSLDEDDELQPRKKTRKSRIRLCL